MAKLWVSMIVAGVIIGSRLISAHPNTPDTLQGREEFLVQGFNKAAPVKAGPYTTVTAAKAHDGVLEIDTTMSPTAPKVTLDESFKRGIVTGACKSPVFDDLLKRGGSLRFMITTGGGTVLPVVVSPTDCSAA